MINRVTWILDQDHYCSFTLVAKSFIGPCGPWVGAISDVQVHVGVNRLSHKLQ